MVHGPGSGRGGDGVSRLRRARGARSAHRRVDRAVRPGDGPASVRHHLNRHLSRHGRAFDAADGPVDDHHAAALADVVRRIHPAREHARVRAKHHAGGADHPFRVARPGGSLPRGRF